MKMMGWEKGWEKQNQKVKSKTIYKKQETTWTAIVKETTRKYGEKDPRRISTCSNCRHGMGVPNGNPIWRCD